MKPLVRVLVLTSALVCSAPLLAQELSVGVVKAFAAEIDDAISRRDIETVIRHLAEHAVLSATGNVQGQMRTFRMNKAQYRQMLTLTWSAASSYDYDRSNEKISIEGDQAIITADIAETMRGDRVSPRGAARGRNADSAGDQSRGLHRSRGLEPYDRRSIR